MPHVVVHLTVLQIINYLRANAHPEMLKRVSFVLQLAVLPSAVVVSSLKNGALALSGL